MKGALSSLFDGQSVDFKSVSRLPCVRTRRNLAEVLKVPYLQTGNKKRRSFPLRSSLDDSNGIPQEVQRLTFPSVMSSVGGIGLSSRVGSICKDSTKDAGSGAVLRCCDARGDLGKSDKL